MNIADDKMIVRLRKAGRNDAELLFNWANDPVVRSNAVHNEPIEWDQHLLWFENKLNSPAIILIMEVNEKPAGQIRFDHDIEKEEWYIDYSIDAGFRGKGLAKKLIGLGLDQLGQGCVTAYVKETNIPSLRTFQSLGFENKGPVMQGNVALIKFQKLS